MAKYQLVPTPNIVKVIDGYHAGLIGEVWMVDDGKVYAVSRSGHYFTTAQDNIEILATRRRRKYLL